ncbi:MCE family protein [Actinomycetes bacterium M1A6_2h]
MNQVSRGQRVQLLAVIVLALVGLSFVGAKYVRLDALMGLSIMTVTAEFADSGGIFTNAEVTYRGTPVGRVGALTLTESGVDVELILDTDSPPVPSDTAAVVADRSAIGEQYVDLRPRTASGPFLGDGSRIALSDTSIPTPVENLLANVDALASDIPADDLHTLVTELGAGFDGTGDSLQSLVTSMDTVTRAGVDALPETLELIRHSRTVLDTQAEQSSSITQFSADLDAVTAQLRSNDPDVRRLIGSGIPASGELGTLLADASPSATANLTALSSTTAALSPRAWALRPLLNLLPTLALGAASTAPGDSTIHLGIVGEVNNPPPCTEGYEGTQQTLDRMRATNPNFDDTEQDFPLDLGVNCTVPQGSETGVRSANRVVFADPSTPQPWDGTPKVAPKPVDLNPIATQLATVLGVTVR